MVKQNKQIYNLTTEEVLKKFDTSVQGISEKEVKRRLEESGYNELPEAKHDNYALIFARQFKSPLIYILLVAGVVVLVMREAVDAAVIFFVLFFNAFVGTIQEGKAQNTFLALKKFIRSRAVVLRGGKEMMVSDREVVAGDMIILREGEKVPADARLIYSALLKVNESALTGESIPKFKIIEAISSSDIPVMNQDNMIFKGTTAVSGNGRAIVTATGEKTFLGEIARETLSIDAEFPLKNDIRKLSRMVILFVFSVSAMLFVWGWFNNFPLKDIFKIAVAVSVSIIPEGLPIVMTLVLAGGVWRMSKKHVLVKKLQAVEVLGETKILAVDKTGTVTKNELLIEDIYSGGKTFEVRGSGYDPKGDVTLCGKTIDPLDHPELLLAGRIAALSGDASVVFEKKKSAWKISGDPTEGAMVVFSKKVGFHREDILSEMPLIDEIPFDYELKFHASLHRLKSGNFMAVTGSPEIVLNLSEKEWRPTGSGKIAEKRNEELKSIISEMSRKGLRIIGFAYAETDEDRIDRKKMPKLVFGGFFGIKDTIREEVRGAVEQVTATGIKVVMITGDHEITARAIAEEAGIWKSGDGILSGDQLDHLSVEALAKKIKNTTVFARVTPSHKLKIINAYRSNGIVVAMTGDGVNDALSLTAADIGISMGKIGTEVAKEASDIILLNDNFANITYGVEEGRNIFITIKKVILYLFSTSLGEVFVLLGALALGFPLPILAAQILWLNLVTDGFLDVSLAMEPKDQARNHYKKTFIVDKLMIQRMFFMAIPMALGTLYLFSRSYEMDLAKAWTISLTTLAVFQWFNAWNCRSERKSIFQLNPFSNKFLIGATFVVIFLQLAAIYIPFMQKILKTVPLEAKDWLTIIAVAFSIIVVEEIRKIVYSKKYA